MAFGSRITSEDVNEYLQEITGEEFTAKDFRTWAGTVMAAMALQAQEPFENKSQAKKNVKAAIGAVARMLGNTPAVCRKCYVASGRLRDLPRRKPDRRIEAADRTDARRIR